MTAADGTWSVDPSQLSDGKYAVYYSPTGADAPYAGAQFSDGSLDYTAQKAIFSVTGGVATGTVGTHALVKNAGAITYTMTDDAGAPVADGTQFQHYLDGASSDDASFANNYYGYYWYSGQGAGLSTGSTVTLGHVLPSTYSVDELYEPSTNAWGYAPSVTVKLGSNASTTVMIHPNASQNIQSLLDFSQSPVETSGSFKVGSTLTAHYPKAPAGAKVAVQWSTLSYAYGDQSIPGATGNTLTLSPALLGQSVAFTVTYYGLPGYDDNNYRSDSWIASRDRIGTGDAKPSSVKITGSASYHATLHASLAAGTVAGSVNAVQWLRDGKAITGASGASYVVTKPDVGHKITARISSYATGYTTSVSTSTAVTPKDSVKLSAKASKKVVTITIKKGVSGAKVGGSIKVYYSATKFKTVKLGSKTTYSVTLPLTKGSHTVKLVFAASTYYKAKAITVKAHV